MVEALMKAEAFVAVITVGNLLRGADFFKEEDSYVLSKIVLRITLPATIISNSSGADLKPSTLVMTLSGFSGGILYITVTFLISIDKEQEERTFSVLSLPGYNIDNFTTSSAQSFLDPVDVVATNLFDTGNAFVCLSGVYSVAAVTREKNARPNLLPIVKTLLKSLPFDTYLIMTMPSFLHVALPAPIVLFTRVIGNVGALVVMSTTGVRFKLSKGSSQSRKIMRILTARYSLTIILALVFYFLLPSRIEYKRALTILALSPMLSATPAFTGNLSPDVGLAGAANSISIVAGTMLVVGTLIMIL